MARKGKATSKTRMRATDLGAVEEGLEAVRTEQIATGAVISEQPSSSLFFLDQAGATETERTEMKRRGLLNLKRPLRIDEILKPQSKVAAIGLARRAKSPHGEGRLVDKRVKAMASKVAKASSTQQKQQTKDAKKTAEYDIWGVGEPGVRVAKVQPPVVRTKAVKVPVPGASYRPEEAEHLKLIEEAARVEMKTIEERERLSRAFPLPLLTGHSVNTVDLAVAEILSGNLQDDEIDADNASDATQTQSDNPNGHTVVARNKKSLKKTERDRKKDSAKKENQRQLKEAAQEKKTRKELNSLKSIIKQIQQEQQQRERMQEERREKARRNSKSLKLRRLGKVAFTPAPVAVQLPEDIPSSLRTLKPEGNQALERFKSLQERALIEPTVYSGNKTAKRHKIIVKTF